MNVIDRSLEFIAAWEPDITSGLRGTSPTDIAALEARMGRPCSPVLRAFHERMGESAGRVALSHVSTSVAMLLDERGTALEELPPNIELLAMSTSEEERDVYLVHDPAMPDDARIVRHPSLEFEETGDYDPANAEAIAGGFGELLCLPVLTRHHVLAQPHRIALTDPVQDDAALARARAIASSFGLEPFWFSNPWTFVGSAEALVVIAKQAPGWFLSVGVAGPERFAWSAVAGTLRFRLGLDGYR